MQWEWVKVQSNKFGAKHQSRKRTRNDWR